MGCSDLSEVFLSSRAPVLLQVEIPNIQKQRKHLAKLVLDMDSSRTRWELQPGCLCWAGVTPCEGLQGCPWLCKSPGWLG